MCIRDRSTDDGFDLSRKLIADAVCKTVETFIYFGGTMDREQSIVQASNILLQKDRKETYDLLLMTSQQLYDISKQPRTSAADFEELFPTIRRCFISLIKENNADDWAEARCTLCRAKEQLATF